MSCDLKLHDLLELSKVFASEDNMPELSDRVLVIDVMKDDDCERMDEVTDETGVEASKHSEEPIQLDKKDEDLNDQEMISKSAECCEENELGEATPSIDQDENASKPESTIEKESQAPDHDVCQEILIETEKATTEVKSQAPDHDVRQEILIETDEAMKDGTETSLLRQHKIFIHSTWLAVQSTYFRSLFFCGMKETNSKEVPIKVSEAEEKSHLTLVKAIYKADILDDVDVDDLLDVLELADKYDVRFVFRKCKYVLQKKTTTFDISKKVMYVIREKHNMMDVEDMAATLQKVMAKQFSPLDNSWEKDEFSSLSEPCVRYTLSNDDLAVFSENTVFHALMYWMVKNNIDPSKFHFEQPCSSLLKVVRFEYVTIDYLYNVVRNHPIARKMPYFQELYLQGMTYHALPDKQKELMIEKSVERKKSSGVLKYSKCLEKNEIEQLKNKDNNTLTLFDGVWCFGYKIQIKLINIYSRWDGWNCSVTINVLDLTSESLLLLKWRINDSSAKGKYFTLDSPSDELNCRIEEKDLLVKVSFAHASSINDIK